MSRVQLALNVSDLASAIDFYRTVFATEPHKLKPGYANFEIVDPPLKLVLIEVDEAERGHGASGALNHLGVEEVSSTQVHHHTERLRVTGLISREEAATVCCYAEQDKIWLQDPNGVPWEYYAITDDAPDEGSGMRINAPEDSPCCT